MTSMGERIEKGDVVDEAVVQSNPPYPLASGTQKEPSDAPWIVREEPISTTRQVGRRSESNTERPGSIRNSKVMPATMYVYPDEKCSNYREVDMLAPDFKTYRRYRQVWVIRDDALAEYIEDLGPSSEFTNGPVHIVGGEGAIIIETYASMCEIADQWRGERMPMPHQRYEMKAFERPKEMVDLLARKVI